MDGAQVTTVKMMVRLQQIAAVTARGTMEPGSGPGTDGRGDAVRGWMVRQATRNIRAAGSLRLPIIGVTAHVLQAERESRSRGMDDQLVKGPSCRDALVDIIGRWLAMPGMFISRAAGSWLRIGVTWSAPGLTI